MPLPQDNRAKVSEVPSKNPRLSLGGNGHHSQIWQVRATVDVALRKVVRKGQFVVGRYFQDMDSILNAPGEGHRRPWESTRAKEKVDLD